MAVIARGLAGISGIFLLSCAICLREDREKRIQARFETLWLELDAVRDRAIPIHLAILKTAATRTTRILDALFGPHIISVHAASVSLCLSIATVYVFQDISEQSIVPLIFAFVLIAGSVAPVWRPHLRVLPKVIAALILVFAPISAVMTDPFFFRMRDMTVGWFGKLATSLGPLVAAVCCDFVIIAVSRVTLRAVSRRTSPATVIVASVAGLLIPIASVLALPFALTLATVPIVETISEAAVFGRGPLQAFEMGQALFHEIDSSILLVAVSNIYSSMGVAIFLFLSLFLVIHLVLWEAIQGPLYAAQRFGIASRHKTLALLGFGFLSVAFAPEKIAWLADALKAF